MPLGGEAGYTNSHDHDHRQEYVKLLESCLPTAKSPTTEAQATQWEGDLVRRELHPLSPFRTVESFTEINA